ncbi:MAG: N-acetylmuramoyl-L-alanine amidase, partial [Acidobacteriota bacterium]
FYLGGTDDPELNALARKENTESGYSMADFRTLLQGIYVDVQQHESRALASSVQSSLYGSLLETNPKLRNRGVKTAPFIVLIGNEMPAILAEVACLSNEKDAELLTKPRYLQFIAESLAKGIRRYADSHRDS